MKDLEMLANIVSGLGDTSLYAFIAYLIKDFIEGLIQAGVIVFVVILAYRFFKNMSECIETIKALRDLFGLGSAGTVQSTECRAVLEKVRELIEQNAQRKDDA